MKIKIFFFSFFFLAYAFCSTKHEDVFTHIYTDRLWRQNRSGPGSSLEQTVDLRHYLQTFLREQNIKSVVDIGCGVFEFQQAIDWSGIDYKGYDIVKSLIDQNNKLYSTENIQFFHANALESDLPPADLLICKDFLQHLPNEDIFRFLSRTGMYRYCLLINDVDPVTLTSSNPQVSLGGYRPIDLTKPPFDVPGEKVLTYSAGREIKQALLVEDYEKELIPYDLTLISPIYSYSLCQYPALWINYLGNDLNINIIPLGGYDLFEASEKVRTVVNSAYQAPGTIGMLLSSLTNFSGEDYYTQVPEECPIKIVYTSYDASQLPDRWVEIINTYFDAAVVLDPWCKTMFEESGITKPIFVLQHGLNLEPFLQQPEKAQCHIPFTFGMSAPFWDRKNPIKLIEAFGREFKNSPNVRLRIHGRGGELEIASKIVGAIRSNKISNVEIVYKGLSNAEYLDFLKSLDCYVFVSKSECYSISPREAMAMGIPCILSNNTAHKTLCASGLVEVVESPIPQPYKLNGVKQAGFVYDCKTRDLQRAMRNVYNDYASALEKATKSREWVKQYTFDALKPLHLALVKPQEIILGDENTLTPYTLTTNSEELYEKYLQFIDQ